jgi:broad specificity phosphatase PhoE
MTEFWIPHSMPPILDSLPDDQPVALLLRHSVRGHLPPGEAGYSVPLTEVGVRLAEQFGEMLGARLRSLHASPLLRCMQTAEAIRRGAQADLPVVVDKSLGDPGVYVVDNKLAGALWQEQGHEKAMAHLVAGNGPLPGLANPPKAASDLVRSMLEATAGQPGIHVFVTHDSLVTATASRWLGIPLGPTDWPFYLEGAFFWRGEGAWYTAYKGYRASRDSANLIEFSERGVVEFARRQLWAVGLLGCQVRFFFAGGAFKSLLTGKPPKDLDLWAPSAEDRSALVAAVLEYGGTVEPPGPYTDKFRVNDHVVELQRKTESQTLEDRLGRFDLTLSAVGVEHLPGQGIARALLRPEAAESVCRREVRLLKPLVNWRHVLATISRMREYAAELCFVVPEEEEAFAWSTFTEQDQEMQAGMLERYRMSSHYNPRIEEEARCRLRR